MTALFSIAFSSFTLGISLIVGIGAQNAFLLRQGLMRQNVLVLVLICAISDVLLISVGVGGVGTFISRIPAFIQVVTGTGALFLGYYGFTSFRRAMQEDSALIPQGENSDLRAAVLACLAFTFLNPNVYLDTVMLIGCLSARFEDLERIAYGAGAAAASVVWFFALGFGARYLHKLFAKPTAWRVLDLVNAAVMTFQSFSLASRLLQA